MMRNFFVVLWGLIALPCIAADTGKIVVDVDKPSAKIGPMFYGLMTEEINHSYDGGLYGELIQNRTFQDDAKLPVHWAAVGDSAIAIDETAPVNSTGLKRSLRVDFHSANSGVANDGFWGIPVWPKMKYRARFYARGDEHFHGTLRVAITAADGLTEFGSAISEAVGSQWKHFEVELNTADVPISTVNRLVITSSEKGKVWLSLVSLFPTTFHDRRNGNRIDLMEKLAELHPSFLRFPGGNYLEGDHIDERFDWKKTIGPIEDRPGHRGCWGYRSSDGLGLLEFLEWCEDLKMEPLLAVYAGYSLTGEHVNAGPEMESFVKEALEEIEYCTGDASTTWGARRIKDGHPEPFVLHFVEIGNEDWFDRSRSYDGRFAQMFDAIKAKYPSLKCISTGPVKSRQADLVDDHAYPSSNEMLMSVHRYDHRDEKLPKVFFGEWATQEGKPTPTLRAALADAAWLTGLQNDASTVPMNCYAPLLVNVNKGAAQWPVNLIGYDAVKSFGSPSFLVQKMFSENWGNVVLPARVEGINAIAKDSLPHGAVGLGTWATQAEFKEVKVTMPDKSMIVPVLADWRNIHGDWKASDEVYSQTSDARPGELIASDAAVGDCTFECKARKIGGREGFVLMFHARDEQNILWCNIGGWDNTRSAIERTVEGHKATLGDSSPFTVETGKWYDLRLELKGRDIRCYVDGKQILAAEDTATGPTETMYVAASRVDATGDIVLKVVNTLNQPQKMEIEWNGSKDVFGAADVQWITGDGGTINTLDHPDAVGIQRRKIRNITSGFEYEFSGSSVTMLVLH